MALPDVRTLVDCTNFCLAVLPYESQFYDLPSQLLHYWSNPTELVNIYLATNPLISAFAFSLFLAPIFLVVSEITKNYSQVDRCWSILPTLYNTHYAIYARMNRLPTGRIDNLLAFSAVWSVSVVIF
jgi:steroid 5-alpha reductase family enzyme